jgi:hypothetical protein
VNTLSKPTIPAGSEPSRDDDPTGVRALLSSLPEPEPMPKHLVERINASLAAEQAERATEISGAPVTPLLAIPRRRSARLIFAIAGAAAALALIAVYSSSLFTTSQTTAISSSARLAGKSSPQEATGGSPPSADYKAPDASGSAATPSFIQIRLSGTRYTAADFAAQAQALRRSPVDPSQPQPSGSSSVGPAGTAPGLRECLSVIGATGAQVVRADVAFYEGRPAVIIVATTRSGQSLAYAVGRQCSKADAAVLRPATPLS